MNIETEDKSESRMLYNWRNSWLLSQFYDIGYEYDKDIF
jgi:hypothetical protein